MSRPSPGTGTARRLTIYLQPTDRAGHHALSTELLARARRAGLAGATLLAGHSGLGRSGRLHHHQLVLDDSPLSLVIVDEAARIDDYLARAGDLLGDVLVVVEEVEALRA